MLVQNKSNFSYEAEGVILIPGTNTVDDKDFDKFISHPLMAKLADRGEFVYEKKLTSISAEHLIALVNDTFDTKTLETMKDGEKRKTVLEAIDKRIEELKNPSKDD